MLIQWISFQKKNLLPAVDITKLCTACFNIPLFHKFDIAVKTLDNSLVYAMYKDCKIFPSIFSKQVLKTLEGFTTQQSVLEKDLTLKHFSRLFSPELLYKH